MGLPIVIDSQLQPEKYEHLPEEVYHADKTAISSSVLKKILKSPLAFKTAFEAPNGLAATPEMRIGKLFHMGLLELPRFAGGVVARPDFGDQRVKTNKEKKVEWEVNLEPGVIAADPAEYELVNSMLSATSKNRMVSKFLAHGVSEVSLYHRDIHTDIKCRTRIDHYNPLLGALVDVKTTQDISREGFLYSIKKWRYDFQLAMYRSAIEQVYKTQIQYVIIIAIEKSPPYESAIYILGEKMMNQGLRDFNRAMKILKKCLETDEWPGYQQEIETIDFNDWMIESLN